MIIRQASLSVIPQIMEVRHSVLENRLSNPDLITELHCAEYLTQRGKGWLCDSDSKIFKLPIIDILSNSVWV